MQVPLNKSSDPLDNVTSNSANTQSQVSAPIDSEETGSSRQSTITPQTRLSFRQSMALMSHRDTTEMSHPDITQVPETLSLQYVQNYQSSRLEPKDLPGTLTNTYQGKVRKNYFIQTEEGKNFIISEASDRTSAFDIPNLIPQVPYKGKVLDTISKHWAAQIEKWGYKTDLVKDHGLTFAPNAAITVREPLETLPIEFVVRRYLTGTTGTSLSSRYFKYGERDYGDFQLEDDLELHSRLDRTILTPTTKEIEDRNVNKAGAVEFILTKASKNEQFNQALDKALSKLQATDKSLSNLSLANPDDRKLLVTKLYEKIEKMVIDVFDKAEQKLKDSAVLLIDTKFELGLDKEGEVRFMDELLTPDSSRYWSKQSLEEAREQNRTIAKGNPELTPQDLFSKLVSPSSVDKDIARNVANDKPEKFEAWKADNLEIIKQNKMKTAAEEYRPYKSQFFTNTDVQKLANGYLHILKIITGKVLNLERD